MKVLILEDHQDAQQWLSEAIQLAFEDVSAQAVEISLAETVASAIEQLRKQAFDLFLVDLHLPDGSGVKALSSAHTLHPEMPAVVASIYSDDEHIFPALRAGASGYLLKDDSKQVIAEMLRDLLQGKPALSAEIASKMLAYFSHQRPGESSQEQPAGKTVQPGAVQAGEEMPCLTQREKEALGYIIKGFSIRECAELMAISPHTVSGYIKEIYKKMHVSSRAEVTTEAIRLGLV